MNIPLHWAKAEVEEPDCNGRPVEFACWRSSDVSVDDARQSAISAARRIVRKLIDRRPLDRYPYGNGPMREEVIERYADAEGRIWAAITRNSYGSLVLNTAEAMFIDLDFPPPAGSDLKRIFAALFRRQSPAAEDSRESDIRARLEQFVAQRFGGRTWGLRLYRTCAGMRALATHELFDPAAAMTLEAMRAMGADPLYVKLCQAQQCFRARLTPKPYRCEHASNTVRWPREDPKQCRLFEKWLVDYQSRQAKYATCRYIGTLGNEAIHPVVQSIIAAHDAATRCHEPLPLA
jgi:plasmid stabilization system protein ParE